MSDWLWAEYYDNTVIIDRRVVSYKISGLVYLLDSGMLLPHDMPTLCAETVEKSIMLFEVALARMSLLLSVSPLM